MELDSIQGGLQAFELELFQVFMRPWQVLAVKDGHG
jgi:hypothetical protein